MRILDAKCEVRSKSLCTLQWVCILAAHFASLQRILASHPSFAFRSIASSNFRRVCGPSRPPYVSVVRRPPIDCTQRASPMHAFTARHTQIQAIGDKQRLAACFRRWSISVFKKVIDRLVPSRKCIITGYSAVPLTGLPRRLPYWYRQCSQLSPIILLCDFIANLQRLN